MARPLVRPPSIAARTPALLVTVAISECPPIVAASLTPLGELFAFFDKKLHDADPIGLVSIDRLSGQKDAARLSVAHETRQSLRKTACAEPAVLDLRGGEFCSLRSDANVTVQGDLEAAAKSPTFHRRDKRLTKGIELERIVDGIAPRPGVGEIVERMKVRPGAERSFARPAHQHAADLSVQFQ